MCEQGIKVVGAGAPASQVQDKPPDRRKAAFSLSERAQKFMHEFKGSAHKAEIEQFIDGLSSKAKSYTPQPFVDPLEKDG